MKYVSTDRFLGPMHRLQTDGTIIGRFKNLVGLVVSVQGIQDRLRQFDPRGHRLASIGVPGRTGQQVQFWFAVLGPNGLQHCSMPPFGRGLQVLVLKLPRFQKDESVEIGASNSSQCCTNWATWSKILWRTLHSEGPGAFLGDDGVVLGERQHICPL
ncbi:hypothetical protein NPIL_11321 [Nephila pilipes]|uniref:Uncharacterized protein n=1 Tax=Nephila pilipes TaxID=299642 RepID=A0A8X6QPC5_NEPPI|nr:hypothetical protein NPIL_11321 [Nephila pilipes]